MVSRRKLLQKQDNAIRFGNVNRLILRVSLLPLSKKLLLISTSKNLARFNKIINKKKKHTKKNCQKKANLHATKGRFWKALNTASPSE